MKGQILLLCDYTSSKMKIYIYIILDKDFQKSGLLFKLIKTSNSSRVSFLSIFSHAVVKKCAGTFLFCFACSYQEKSVNLVF